MAEWWITPAGSKARPTRPGFSDSITHSYGSRGKVSDLPTASCSSPQNGANKVETPHSYWRVKERMPRKLLEQSPLQCTSTPQAPATVMTVSSIPPPPSLQKAKYFHSLWYVLHRLPLLSLWHKSVSDFKLSDGREGSHLSILRYHLQAYASTDDCTSRCYGMFVSCYWMMEKQEQLPYFRANFMRATILRCFTDHIKSWQQPPGRSLEDPHLLDEQSWVVACPESCHEDSGNRLTAQSSSS